MYFAKNSNVTVSIVISTAVIKQSVVKVHGHWTSCSAVHQPIFSIYHINIMKSFCKQNDAIKRITKQLWNT